MKQDGDVSKYWKQMISVVTVSCGLERLKACFILALGHYVFKVSGRVGGYVPNCEFLLGILRWGWRG